MSVVRKVTATSIVTPRLHTTNRKASDSIDYLSSVVQQPSTDTFLLDQIA